MSAQIDVPASRPAVEDSRPATFLERGVTVPFTTPMLLGSRVRPGRRHDFEVAVPSPAGIRGFYVLPLKSLRDICVPTLHDRLVIEVLEDMAVLTPDAILRIARAAAQERLAGRAAAAAAAAAEKAISGRKLFTNYTLLLQLISQTESPAERSLPPERDTPVHVQHRGQRAVGRTSQALGMTPDEVVKAMEGLAEAYLDLGFRGNPTKARYQQQLDRLDTVSAEIAAWADAAIDAQLASSASLVARSAHTTLCCGRVLLEDLLASTEDLPNLVVRWRQDPDAVRSELGKLAWLLDGWSMILGVWDSAPRIGLAAAIQEMVVMVPSMPFEVNKWVGGPEQEYFAEAHRRRSRSVFRLEEWRTGRTIDLILRNEMIVRDFV